MEMNKLNNKRNNNKAIIDIILRPRCALPSPPSQPIGRIACTQIFRIPLCACLAYWMILSDAWRYWRLNDPFCSERVTIHDQWRRKTQNCPSPLGFRHPAGGGPSHVHRQHAQKKVVKIALVVPEISSRTHRHTDTQTDIHRSAHHNTSWAK